MKAILFTALLGALLLSTIYISGCAGQGETAAELKRARLRTRVADRQAMFDDFETVMMIDRPSKLTDKTVR